MAFQRRVLQISEAVKTWLNNTYSGINHNHDGRYALTNHTHPGLVSGVPDYTRHQPIAMNPKATKDIVDAGAARKVIKPVQGCYLLILINGVTNVESDHMVEWSRYLNRVVALTCHDDNGTADFRNLVATIQQTDPLYRCMHWADTTSVLLPLSPDFYYHMRCGMASSTNEVPEMFTVSILPALGTAYGKIAEIYNVHVSWNGSRKNPLLFNSSAKSQDVIL